MNVSAPLPGASRQWALLLALGLLAMAGRAGAQPVLVLGTNFVAQGRSVSVPLWLAGASDLAGLQVDLQFEPASLQTNGFSVTSSSPGVLADGGAVGSNRLRVVLLATNGTALSSGLIALLHFAIDTDAPDGFRRVPLLSQPGGRGLTISTNGTCGSVLAYQAGQLFVGDAFGFVPNGGRAQFRVADGFQYAIVATTNLTSNLAAWTPIGTNVGANGLAFWIDRDVTNYPRRFYRAKAP